MRKRRIVVLGGGFAGVECTRQLEKGLRSNSKTDILLVSENNFLLFRPMLPQVASGTIKTRNIVMPIRSILKKARFYEGRVKDIDPMTRKVSLWGTAEKLGITVDYDYLVVALGSETNFFGMSDLENNAFRMKTLNDAVTVRNRVIDMLEQAANETDEGVKRSLLTFMIVGGGFSGIETAGELHDLLVDATKYYPDISKDEVDVTVVESQSTILSGFSKKLAKFTHDALVQRGTHIRLMSRVTSFDGREAVIEKKEGGPEIIRTKTLIWTAGLTPVSTIKRSVFKTVEGKMVVDDYLEVDGYPGVFAAGDCVLFMNPDTGRPYPPTGQMAVSQGRSIAHNLNAVINGQPKKKFTYKPEGHMAVIGKRTGIAVVFGMKMQGMAAWLLWRLVFIYKMPLFAKRLRVLMDWTEDILFDRDIARLKFMKREERVKEYRDLNEVDEFW